MRISIFVLVVVFSLLIPLPLLSDNWLMGTVPDDNDMGVRVGIGDSLTKAGRDLAAQSPEPSVNVAPTPTPSPTLSPEPSPSPTVCSVCFAEINGYVRDAITAAPIEGAIVEYKHIISAFNESTEADSDGYYLINYARHCEDLSNPVEIACAAEGYLSQSVWERIYCYNIHNISFNLMPEPSPQPSASITPTPSPTLSPKPSPSATICPSCIVSVGGHVIDAVTSDPIPGATVEFCSILFTVTATADNDGLYTLNIILGCTNPVIPTEILCDADRYIGQSVWEDLVCGTFHNISFNLMPESSVSFSNCAGGDYDGDGTSDIAIFRTSSGLWAVRGLTRFYYGQAGDRPVSGDYNGDGTTEAGIFRPSDSLWAIRDLTRFEFGEMDDQAVPGDYDGDGTTEPGAFRGQASLWMVRGVTRAYFGREGDIPVPGDYRGDGTSVMAIFRPGVGLWAIRGLTRWYFGREGDWPTFGDYGGNGTAGIGVYRPACGLWAVRGRSRVYYGREGDWLVPADYAGCGTAALGIFRSKIGLWAVREMSRTYFGKAGDIPLAR